MADASEATLSPEVIRLRAEVREHRYRDIAESLTTRTTIEAIEAADPYLTQPVRGGSRAAEWEESAAAWRLFRATAADGGEVWEFRCLGPCSCEVGFAVVRAGRVVADSVTAVSTWK